MKLSGARAVKRFKGALWPRLTRRLPWNAGLAYSQYGEDRVLAWLTRERGRGFYADLGAYHPVHLSNTYALYCRGWRGINVEPRPGALEEFEAYRPRDVNLACCAVAEPAGERELWVLDPAALSTLDPELAERRLGEGARLVERRRVEARTLDEILAAHLPEGTDLDLLAVDLEGLDEEVLASLDWRRWAPWLVVCEVGHLPYREVPAAPLVGLVESRGYDLVTRVGRSAIFERRSPPAGG